MVIGGKAGDVTGGDDDRFAAPEFLEDGEGSSGAVGGDAGEEVAGGPGVAGGLGGEEACAGAGGAFQAARFLLFAKLDEALVAVLLVEDLEQGAIGATAPGRGRAFRAAVSLWCRRPW